MMKSCFYIFVIFCLNTRIILGEAILPPVCRRFNPDHEELTSGVQDYCVRLYNITIWFDFGSHVKELCDCWDALREQFSHPLDCINNTDCTNLCYRNGKCELSSSCGFGSSGIDVCLLHVEEENLTLAVYDLSCQIVVQHAEDVCSAVDDNDVNIDETVIVIVIAAGIIVLIMFVISCSAIIAIVVYAYKKNKSHLQLFQVYREPNHVLKHLESPVYSATNMMMNGLLPKEKVDMYKQQFSQVLYTFSDIQYTNELAEGAFGKVYKGVLNTFNGELTVAIKTILKANSMEEVEDFISESAVMLDFDHPNVLKLLGVCFDTDDQLPVIILPYMANGDLKSFLIDKRGDNEPNMLPEGLTIEILVKMCNDIANGMDYLSSLKFVHRDLAARNCMIDDKLSVKVADFGFSRDIYTKEYYRLERRTKLPVKWLPPESLLDNIYNEKTDVWSFGVVCWEIFSLGRSPYPGIDNGDIPEYISNGYRLKQPTLCPNEVYIIMWECWDHNPMERPAFALISKRIELLL